jgi:hypothetical protein
VDVDSDVDISVVHAVSIFRVREYNKRLPWKPKYGNRNPVYKQTNGVPPKRRLLQEPPGVTFRKMAFLVTN